jgi:hypothetical protein
MFSAWWKSTKPRPEAPVEAPHAADNESPGESGQLSVTAFADLIAWNSRIFGRNTRPSLAELGRKTLILP